MVRCIAALASPNKDGSFPVLTAAALRHLMCPFGCHSPCEPAFLTRYRDYSVQRPLSRRGAVSGARVAARLEAQLFSSGHLKGEADF